MTHAQLTRFTCDRCEAVVDVLHNDQPGWKQGQAPGDWRVLRIGFEQSLPPMHLCATCSARFASFLKRTAE